MKRIEEFHEDKIRTALSLHPFGIIEQKKGNYEEAERLYNESLAIKKELGDREGIAKSLYNLGKIQQDRKNYEEAIQALSEAASVFEELKSPYFEDVIRSLDKIKAHIKTIAINAF